MILTLFDNMEIELGKTKEHVAYLELQNSKLQEQLVNGGIVDNPSLNDELSKLKEEKVEAVLLISSLNDELSRMDKLSLWYEAKFQKFENEAASLRKELACESNVASVSPNCEISLLNEKVEKLESENLKLNEIIKNFTRSQTSLDKMIGGFGSNQNKQGLGYKPKPRKTNKRMLLDLLPTPQATTIMDFLILLNMQI